MNVIFNPTINRCFGFYYYYYFVTNCHDLKPRTTASSGLESPKLRLRRELRATWPRATVPITVLGLRSNGLEANVAPVLLVHQFFQSTEYFSTIVTSMIQTEIVATFHFVICNQTERGKTKVEDNFTITYIQEKVKLTVRKLYNP